MNCLINIPVERLLYSGVTRPSTAGAYNLTIDKRLARRRSGYARLLYTMAWLQNTVILIPFIDSPPSEHNETLQKFLWWFAIVNYLQKYGSRFSKMTTVASKEEMNVFNRNFKEFNVLFVIAIYILHAVQISRHKGVHDHRFANSTKLVTKSLVSTCSMKCITSETPISVMNHFIFKDCSLCAIQLMGVWGYNPQKLGHFEGLNFLKKLRAYIYQHLQILFSFL